ncbi:MAG: hypothetical protein M3M96_02970 [Candidatus Eremiobacteraeota bacterium]|nr:hypothetical protein [Candidatus Eremiobacteraeota bacterium]
MTHGNTLKERLENMPIVAAYIFIGIGVTVSASLIVLARPLTIGAYISLFAALYLITSGVASLALKASRRQVTRR